MLIGVVIQSTVLGYITYKTDWEEQVTMTAELEPNSDYYVMDQPFKSDINIWTKYTIWFQVKRASERLNKWLLKSTEESNESPDQERLIQWTGHE